MHVRGSVQELLPQPDPLFRPARQVSPHANVSAVRLQPEARVRAGEWGGGAFGINMQQDTTLVCGCFG